MQTESEQLLLAEYAMGDKADEFLAGDLGRYVIGRCDQEIEVAQEALARVSPWRRRRIAELQNQIWRAKSMKTWLNDLVSAGIQAQALLENGHED